MRINMKKYFAILFLIAFIIPSVASASWWNPFSWKVFQKKATAPQVQVETQKTPEQKISELQKQLDDLKKEQPDSKSATITPKANKETKKDAPVVDNSVIIKAQKDALIAKQKANEQARINALKVEAERQDQMEAEEVRKALERADRDARDAQEEANEKAEAKQNKLDAISLKIANLNAKYAKDSADIKHNKSGMLQSGMDAMLNMLYSKYEDEYNALMAEWQQIKYSN